LRGEKPRRNREDFGWKNGRKKNLDLLGKERRTNLYDGLGFGASEGAENSGRQSKGNELKVENAKAGKGAILSGSYCVKAGEKKLPGSGHEKGGGKTRKPKRGVEVRVLILKVKMWIKSWLVAQGEGKEIKRCGGEHYLGRGS